MGLTGYLIEYCKQSIIYPTPDASEQPWPNIIRPAAASHARKLYITVRPPIHRNSIVQFILHNLLYMRAHSFSLSKPFTEIAASSAALKVHVTWTALP